jgi:hypothetical protein
MAYTSSRMGERKDFCLAAETGDRRIAIGTKGIGKRHCEDGACVRGLGTGSEYLVRKCDAGRHGISSPWRCGAIVGHPRHRPSCQSVLYRARCRHCGQEPIYVYGCSCHSGRLLEENRPPWTPHDCLTVALEREEAEFTEEAREAFKRKYSGSRLITAVEYRKAKSKKRRPSTPLPKPKNRGLLRRKRR